MTTTTTTTVGKRKASDRDTKNNKKKKEEEEEEDRRNKQDEKDRDDADFDDNSADDNNLAAREEPDVFGLLRSRRFLPMLAGHAGLLRPKAALDRLRTMTARPNWVRRHVDGVEERAEVYYKYAPMLDPYYHLTGRYDVAERAEMPSNAYRAYVTRHQKIMDPMNSAAMDALGAHVSGELFRQGLPTALESFGYRVGMKREFRFDVGSEYMYDCDDWDVPENAHRFAWSRKPADYEERKADLEDMKREQDEEEEAAAAAAAAKRRRLDDKDEEEDEEECCEHCQLEGCQGECCDGDALFEDQLERAAAATTSRKGQKNDRHGEQEQEEDDDREDQEDHDWWSYGPGEATVDLFRVPVVMVGIERCAGGTLEDFLLARNKSGAPLSEAETDSLILQLVFTLAEYQRAYQFVHGDLHMRNIMIVPTALEHLQFAHAGVEYRVPTFGRVYKMVDFGRSSFVLDGRFFVSDAFAPHGDGSGMFNCGPSEDPTAPTVPPSRSFDLALLSGILFELLVGDAFMDSWNANGVMPAPLTPAQQVVFDWGIMSQSGVDSSLRAPPRDQTAADPELAAELKDENGEDDADSFESRYLLALDPAWVNQHSVFLPTGRPRFDAWRSFKINQVIARFAHGAVPEDLLRRFLRPETQTWSFSSR